LFVRVEFEGTVEYSSVVESSDNEEVANVFSADFGEFVGTASHGVRVFFGFLLKI
jgi:hypothetical protein